MKNKERWLLRVPLLKSLTLGPWWVMGRGAVSKPCFLKENCLFRVPAARSGLGEKGTEVWREIGAQAWGCVVSCCQASRNSHGLGGALPPVPTSLCDRRERAAHSCPRPCHGPASHEATNSGEQSQSLWSIHCLPRMCQVLRGECC